MIILKNISHYFTEKNKPILQNINWSIHKGENWILFGSNGSGKTKLLEIISGYLFPSIGTVERFGHIGGRSDIRKIRKRIGYCSSFVRDHTFPKELVIDIILSGLNATIGLYEQSGKKAYEDAFELLKNVGLIKKSHDKFNTLSEGMKQKVLLLRAIISDPELLILDEPVNGLDISAREDFLESLTGLSKKKHFSILYVTHHTDEITPLFSKILILQSNGTIFYKGDMHNGLTDAHLSELFSRKVALRMVNGRYYTILE